ncbi:LytR/AlgR family response regulator transcription factor [uncultured Hymenobacter sp.]|uniref:LytR/AlgR family response regulator transcription factor n=1 Tax=uncultured Hymenobacter sp. TaxID=170016 RepID=UPI0035C9E130
MALPPPAPATPLRCLIVDDDPLARQVVENCVTNTAFLEAVGTCDSAVAAAEVLRTTPVDVLFLDVEMPLMSGLDLLGTLAPDEVPAVVLITSNPSYAVQAFEFHVVDYLVKPISYARFLTAARHALAAVEARRALTAAPAPTPPTDAEAEFTFIKVDNKLVRVAFAEVRYVEALGDYVHVVLDGQKLIVHSTMRAVEEKFPARDFARVHRSFIVNLRHVQAIEDNTVVMGKKRIAIGQTYLREVLQRLNKF